MSDPSDGTVRSYIGTIDEVIAWGQASGLAGEWHSLLRRLHALGRGPADAEADTPGGPAVLYRLEHDVAIEVSTEVLTPAVLEDLVGKLRAGRGAAADLGSWAALDARSFERTLAAERRHETSVLTALARHARKPRYANVLEAVRALEDLQRSRERRLPGRDTTMLEREATRLAEAMEEVLPPLARRLLSDEIEVRFRSEFEARWSRSPSQ